MSKMKWEASLYRLLIQHLRVPELVYPFELGSSDALAERNRQLAILQEQCAMDKRSGQNSLVQMLNKTFEDRGCIAQANNLAFFLDRVFDVWLRKNAFQEELSLVFQTWRFVLFKFSIPVYAGMASAEESKGHEQQLGKLISLMDSIGKFARKWSPVPKRSKQLFLDQLKKIESSLDDTEGKHDSIIDIIEAQWYGFIDKQDEKNCKISERLIQSEYRKNHTQYCLWLAYHYLNVLFKKRTLPSVLQDFLREFWVGVVARKIEASLPEQLSSREAIVVSSYNEKLDQSCKNIVRVFCHKGESSFQLADQIIEDLQEMSKGVSLTGSNTFLESQSAPTAFFSDESLWRELSECLVLLLQGQLSEEEVLEFELLQLPEHLENTFGDIDQFKNGAIQFENLNISLSDWFELYDQDELITLKLIADFKQSQQLLFSNYLGMKAAQLSYHEFAERLVQGNIKKLAKTHAFSSVFDQAITGLAKIAENQKQARLQAAEKAKAEAEKMLEDRRKAEEQSRLRAEEIAQRTKQLLAKRADKERLEKENAVAQLIRAFNLGAWISINTGGEALRYKLVVKLAATGKYVFVDRLGIKKREFIEADLVQALINKDIEILSDGAEFEESLERVVSRIRMSK